MPRSRSTSRGKTPRRGKTRAKSRTSAAKDTRRARAVAAAQKVFARGGFDADYDPDDDPANYSALYDEPGWSHDEPDWEPSGGWQGDELAEEISYMTHEEKIEWLEWLADELDTTISDLFEMMYAGQGDGA